MQVLDTDFGVVAEFRDIGGTTRSPNDTIVDGNVDVDTTRLTRRTFTANVLNEDAQWSPGSTWAGTFYVNRLVRLFRGIDYGDGEELVPIGTFMIDHADVAVERNMSVVVLSGSDLWKKLGKAVFPGAKSWPIGTNINDVINYIAASAGITRRNLDPLTARVTADRQLQKVFAVEQGDNKGEAVAKLCADLGIDIYFDVMGTLVTQDFRRPGDTAVVYTYDPAQNNNLVTVKSSYTDENLYNAVLVIGTKDKDNIVKYRIRDTDLDSVTNIYRLGERVLVYESDNISTVSAAAITAEKLFYRHVLINEDITLETICNPAYEGNDVIRVRELDFSKLDSVYRIKAFTVPMSTSKQTVRLLREIKLT